MALTKLELDKMAMDGCQTPGCTHKDHALAMFLHSRCHPAAGLEVNYCLATGLLSIGCWKCHKLICEIEVAG